MNTQKQKKHLDKLWKKMQKRFQSFLHTGHGEQLHQFRIQVKKIKSFLVLLEADKKNHRLLAEFKPVRKIFKSAGVVRDAVLHRNVANEQGIPLEAFYQKEEKAMQQERDKLMDKGKAHLRKMKNVKKKLHKQLHSVSGGDMKTFFQNQIDTTYRLLGRHNFTERLHNGRKALKHLLYNQQAAQQALGKWGINFTYIDELQETLGQWHDNKVTLDFFSGKPGVKIIDGLETKNKALQQAVIQKSEGFQQHIRSR